MAGNPPGMNGSPAGMALFPASKSDFLFLYDAEMGWAARPHYHPGALSIGVKGGITGLKSVLTQLLAESKTFERVMFYTHGNSGKIFFGEQRGNRTIDAGVLQTKLNGYDALFPKFTRMYFAGCNVAEDEVGWKFLETAGKVFLKRGGGMTFGWDSVGLGVGGNLIADMGAAVVGGVGGGLLLHNLLEGKVEHPTGTACYVWIQIGGDPVHRYYDSSLGNKLAHLALQILP